MHTLLLWSSGLSIRRQTVLDRLGNVDKRVLHADIILGRAFKKGHIELLSERLSFLRRHDLFIDHIALIADENLIDVDIGVLIDLGNPIAKVLNTPAIRHVIDEQNTLSTTAVAYCDFADR